MIKNRQLKYYSKPSIIAIVALGLSNLFSNSKLKRLSSSNRIIDYSQLLKLDNAALWDIHKKINTVLIEQNNQYKGYDYGEGYFYQSFDKLQITGYRNTAERLNKLDLFNRLQNKSIIDIGCNAGFLLLSLSTVIKNGYGFDINPYLIKTANLAKSHLNISNCDFLNSTFEELQIDNQYDVVLSLANHSTFDKNTKHNLDEYFGKCANLLKTGGEMIFESHPLQLEDENKIKEIIKIISMYFKIKSVKKYDFSGFLDKNRTYVSAITI